MLCESYYFVMRSLLKCSRLVSWLWWEDFNWLSDFDMFSKLPKEMEIAHILFWHWPTITSLFHVSRCLLSFDWSAKGLVEGSLWA